MNARFTTDETTKLSYFVGYGDLKARVWFIGMEEGLPRNADGLAAFRARLHFEPVEDLYRAHQLLADADPTPNYLKHFVAPYTWQQTWWPMCELMLRLSGRAEINANDKREYMAKRLGRAGDETFLLELLPLPASNIGQWTALGYDQLFEPHEHFRTREDYRAWVMPQRINLLRKVLMQYSPPLVVCYGSAYHPEFKQLFRDVEAWIRRGVFSLGRAHKGKVVILAPHFTSRRMTGQVHIIYQMILDLEVHL